MSSLFCIAIMGPTGVGKSGLGIKLAEEFNGEIISVDSMQIYKYLDIGTAKPQKSELQNITHYLIDIVEPDKNFSAGQFKDLALQLINNILEKKKSLFWLVERVFILTL
ncbi:MAG TPA: isopentenyl transferase family protein [Spirochaetota bacterium]|nr:isopentenyl transferase family protein [Spirochaetota bacterium]